MVGKDGSKEKKKKKNRNEGREGEKISPNCPKSSTSFLPVEKLERQEILQVSRSVRISLTFHCSVSRSRPRPSSQGSETPVSRDKPPNSRRSLPQPVRPFTGPSLHSYTVRHETQSKCHSTGVTEVIPFR